MQAAAFSLEGRAALITGAGSPSGIGFACARLLGELGAAVFVTSTTGRAGERASELRAGGITAEGAPGDLTDEADVERVVGQALDTLGRIDILVNNAGMTSVTVSGAPEAGQLAGVSPDAWRASIARNLDSVFLVSRAVVPHMQRIGWGRVIAITGRPRLRARRHHGQRGGARVDRHRVPDRRRGRGGIQNPGGSIRFS
ncbi:MAG TPA: SDR family NAD(P)-dependent oxidoreductase [Acidimicrobiia bacterium]